jgi:hypothetical protein
MHGPIDDELKPRPSTLAEIRESLAHSLKWEADRKPAPAELPVSHPTERGVRGFLGEEHLAREATARGEIILDGPRGIEDWNKSGPDLITLAENEHGLVLRFYDNKAYTNERNVSSVEALEKNFDAKVKQFAEDCSAAAKDPARPPSEQRLLDTVAKLAAENKVERWVANSGGAAKGVTARLAANDFRFTDTAGGPSTNERASTHRSADGVQKLAGPRAASEVQSQTPSGRESRGADSAVAARPENVRQALSEIRWTAPATRAPAGGTVARGPAAEAPRGPLTISSQSAGCDQPAPRAPSAPQVAPSPSSPPPTSHPGFPGRGCC